MKVLAASVTGCTDLISISVSDSHSSPTSTAQILAVNSSLDIGDSVTIIMGYVGDQFTAFVGYVKDIELKEPEQYYSITCANVMIRAMDYFIAASSPTQPYTWNNITAEDLIQEVLSLSGLTSFDLDATSFTFAVHNPVEVNLTSAFDYARFLADIIAYNLYANNTGTVKLVNRRPYPMGSDTPVATLNSSSNILSATYGVSDRDLRNKVIVYGTGDISATASASSPYLPAGYYRTVVVAAPGVIDTQSMAQQAADYNLDLLNKLTYRLSLSMEGYTNLFARSVVTITLSELGITSQDWYIFAFEHNWSRQGFITNLELRR
jgi:phage protein D